MAWIRCKDTAPELAVRRALYAAGLRFRLHPASLSGRPNIVLPRHHAAIFVHGCFWHRHTGCSSSVLPKTNRAWWIAKLRRNRLHDRRNQRGLKRLGWRVVVIWE
jgi:DNA mismatch endonuclease (patch repair protein)